MQTLLIRAFVILALCQALCFSPAQAVSYKLTDCGVPLSKTVYFEEMTIYPEIPSPHEMALLNIKTFFKSSVTSGTTARLQIYFNGQLYVDTGNTVDFCAMRDTISCPIAAGSLSYTDLFDVVTIPDGNYKALFEIFTGTTQIGCANIEFSTNDISSVGDSNCQFSSSAAITLNSAESLLQFQRGTKTALLGDWVQVGTIGYANSFVSASFPFGHFASVTGTEDLLGSTSLANIDKYIWGFFGTIYQIDNAATFRREYMNGTFYVGYMDDSITLATPATALAVGKLELVRMTTNYTTGNYVFNSWISAAATVTPSASLAPNWGLLTTFGRLNPFSMSLNGQGNMVFYGATPQICGCGINACGNCTNDMNVTCGSQAVTTTTTGVPATTTTTTGPAVVEDSSSSESLSIYGKFVIVISVIGVCFIIGAVALIYILLRQNSATGNYGDDLLDPQKPDYGSLAIADVLNDTDDIPAPAPAPERRRY